MIVFKDNEHICSLTSTFFKKLQTSYLSNIREIILSLDLPCQLIKSHYALIPNPVIG